MSNHTVEEFYPLNSAFAVTDPKVSKLIPNRLIPGRLLDPNLFYRHDHHAVEVRFVNGSQQAVCGTLTAEEFSKSLGNPVRTFLHCNDQYAFKPNIFILIHSPG
jgi:hypothetical protein